MHRLFFAIFPDRVALAAIGRLVDRLRAENIVRGRWLAPDRYHVTVRFLGDYEDAAATRVSALACEGGARLQAAPFTLTLDRVATFRGRFRAPCVLHCSLASVAALSGIREQLERHLDPAGIDDRERRRFQPHLTIAYVDRTLDAAIEVEPIEWHATSLALVDSHRAEHAVLARWRLDN